MFLQRRDFWMACLCGVLAVISGSSVRAADAPAEYWVFIASSGGAKGPGVYVSRLDLKTGALSPAELAGATKSPSFLAIAPNGRYLYSCGDVTDATGKQVSGVAAFAIDANTGKLKLLNAQSSEGAGPCHIVVDKTGKNLLVANYSGGSVASLPIQADGTLAKAASTLQHTGSSVNKQRQEGPHAHSINVDSNSKFVFAADLGLDKVLVYKLDAAKGTLTPNDPPGVSVTPGVGPRHFAILPGEKFAYVINEIGNTVTAFEYDATRGTLKTIQEITTLPEGYKETSHTAEIVAHPSGKFIYGSNRGHDSIAIFAVDPQTGKLTAKGQQLTGGKMPRNFVVDPTGTYLLAENLSTNTVVVFRIDPQTGLLKETGHKLDVHAPMCIRMLPVPK